jgi:site-specific recombinase XerD
MFLFVDRRGQALKQRHLAQIIHRVSTKAGLAHHRRLHPHRLRHFAATSWLRGGAGPAGFMPALGDHAALATA